MKGSGQGGAKRVAGAMSRPAGSSQTVPAATGARPRLPGPRAPALLPWLGLACLLLPSLLGWGCPARQIGQGRPLPGEAVAEQSKDPGTNREWATARELLQQGQTQRGREALEGFLQQHPADVLAPQASLLLARLRLADGDLDGALRLAEVMADGPAEVQGEARLLLGR
ncbi:MAG: hypothetical protein FJ125_11940, partial [Deltaproteobacteria bacterium]|nr:hypothetical protein [Deltaproteobacteria bacterium]